ncbi:hypothetical protein Ciccas_011019 [Cichlidogyrus casuarinus]|uniref:Uncharacterized protein n=1 Tax=Cichlidogyrus casuarinus TaxID=1844966 RepID=A0ABD2PSG2_9PLAT
MRTFYLVAVISLLWVGTNTQGLQPFCLTGATPAQCISQCKSTECARALNLMIDMLVCLQTSLRRFKQTAGLLKDEKTQICRTIQEFGQLRKSVVTVLGVLPNQADSFYENLVSVSGTSIPAFLDMTYRARNTAFSYQSGLCPIQDFAFTLLLTEYNQIK